MFLDGLLYFFAAMETGMNITEHYLQIHINYVFKILQNRGATIAEKLRGTKVWVPTPGRLRLAQAGLVVDAGGGRPPDVGVRGVTPRKCLRTHTQSCILVTTTLISGLPRTCISEQTTSMSRAQSVPIG